MRSGLLTVLMASFVGACSTGQGAQGEMAGEYSTIMSMPMPEIGDKDLPPAKPTFNSDAKASSAEIIESFMQTCGEHFPEFARVRAAAKQGGYALVSRDSHPSVRDEFGPWDNLFTEVYRNEQLGAEFVISKTSESHDWEAIGQKTTNARLQSCKFSAAVSDPFAIGTVVDGRQDLPRLDRSRWYKRSDDYNGSRMGDVQKGDTWVTWIMEFPELEPMHGQPVVFPENCQDEIKCSTWTSAEIELSTSEDPGAPLPVLVID